MPAICAFFLIMSCFTEYQLNKMMISMHVLDHKNFGYHVFSSILRICWILLTGWLALSLPLFLVGLFLLLFLNVVPYRNRSLLMNNFTMVIYLLYSSLLMLVIGIVGLCGISFDQLMQDTMLRILVMTTAFLLHNSISFILLRYKPAFLWKEEFDRVKVLIYTRFLFICILYHMIDAVVLASYQSITVSYLLLISGDLLILLLMFLFLNYNQVFINSELLRKEYEEREVLIAQQYFEKETLKHLSEYDPLTSAYNRREICSLMQKGLQEGHHLICVFADLDGLKRMNDRYGHTFGDLMLKRFANGCTRMLGEEGSLARIGGDEFLLVFFDQEPDAIEARIKELQLELMQAKDEKDKVFFSYGISCDEQSVDDYITAADQKMYVNKKRKRGEVK